MTSDQITTVICLVAFIIILLYIKNSKEVKVINALMEASDEFITWRKENTRIYLGLSDKGKELLTRLILRRDDFVRTFPYADGDEHRAHREYLMSLFDELPPLPHKPTPTSKPPPLGGLLFLDNKTVTKYPEILTRKTVVI